MHYNITQPVGMAREAFMALWDEIMRAVHDVVVDMGGSISAEHGIGFMKREELAHVKSDVELDLMRKIKAAFDPRGYSIRARCCTHLKIDLTYCLCYIFLLCDQDFEFSNHACNLSHQLTH